MFRYLAIFALAALCLCMLAGPSEASGKVVAGVGSGKFVNRTFSVVTPGAFSRARSFGYFSPYAAFGYGYGAFAAPYSYGYQVPAPIGLITAPYASCEVGAVGYAPAAVYAAPLYGTGFYRQRFFVGNRFFRGRGFRR